jgi:adenylate cyclase
VLVDDALAASLTSLSGFQTTALRRRSLRGIGQVTPSELRRSRGVRTNPSGGNAAARTERRPE